MQAPVNYAPRSVDINRNITLRASNSRAFQRQLVHTRHHHFANTKRLGRQHHLSASTTLNLSIDEEKGAVAKKHTPLASSWRVRKLTLRDIDAATILQANAFHEKQAIPFVDNLAYKSFYAEVKDGLHKKLQLMGPVFTVLVAEPLFGDGNAVGIVEVAIGFDPEVLSFLPPGTESYCYISSMAVSSKHRRQGIASALLKEAQNVAISWQQKMCVLHVYEDNQTASCLYEQRGFTAAAKDPKWRSWLGARIRVLMLKEAAS